MVNFTGVNSEQRFCKNYIYKIIIFGSDPRQTLPALPKDSRSVINAETKKRQFPVRLCFAMTISKAQGQSIDNLGIYFPQPAFSHGQ